MRKHAGPIISPETRVQAKHADQLSTQRHKHMLQSWGDTTYFPDRPDNHRNSDGHNSPCGQDCQSSGMTQSQHSGSDECNTSGYFYDPQSRVLMPNSRQMLTHSPTSMRQGNRDGLSSGEDDSDGGGGNRGGTHRPSNRGQGRGGWGHDDDDDGRSSKSPSHSRGSRCLHGGDSDRPNQPGAITAGFKSKVDMKAHHPQSGCLGGPTSRSPSAVKGSLQSSILTMNLCQWMKAQCSFGCQGSLLSLSGAKFRHLRENPLCELARHQGMHAQL
jgi:hypothetical protein